MKNKFRQICSLLLGFSSIYLLAIYGLPFLDNTLGFKEAHDILIEEKIESGAWYYIFVEKVGPSSENIRHSLKYNPMRNKDGK